MCSLALTTRLRLFQDNDKGIKELDTLAVWQHLAHTGNAKLLEMQL